MEGPLVHPRASEVPSKQFLLLALCINERPDAVTIAKTVALVMEWTPIDAGFVLCVDEAGNTPLHLACRANNTAVSQFLVEHTTIRVDRRNSRDELAIHWALRHRNLAVFETLVKRSPARLLTHGTFRGTSASATSSSAGRGGQGGSALAMETLLHVAARCDTSPRAVFVARLVLAGADPLCYAAADAADEWWDVVDGGPADTPAAAGGEGPNGRPPIAAPRREKGDLAAAGGLSPPLATSAAMSAYDVAKQCNPQPYAALLLNNYLVNRAMAEGHATFLPADLNDDLVLVRKARCTVASDGYTLQERLLIFNNQQWWLHGLDAVIALTEYGETG